MLKRITRLGLFALVLGVGMAPAVAATPGCLLWYDGTLTCFHGVAR